MPVIEVQHLHKTYGDKVAVDDVSFAVERGEIFGILGPNGAGKTTTVECIEGLRAPDTGRISVLGLDPRRDRAELTQRLGVQLQDSQLPDQLRVAEAVRSAAQGDAVLSPSVAARLMNRFRAPGAGPLSQRELEVLELVAAGATNREAAARLFISEATVKSHLMNIYAKLGVSDRAAAVGEAFNRGLLTPEAPER